MAEIPTPDFTMLARRPSERLMIVEHILGTLGLQETDYLEWKTAYDLATRPGAASTARQLIGMANRDETQAVRHVEGYGYLLVGLEPGNLVGVPAWDSANIENWLNRYVDPRLRYDVHYVEKDGKNVLFVTIDPPRQGDPIYCLRATSQDQGGQSLPKGTIYVRRSGLTEPAGPEDIDRLAARLAPITDGGSAVITDLRVEFDVSRVSLIDPALLTDEFRDEYLDRWRGKILAQLPKPKPVSAHIALLNPVSMIHDNRTREQYIAEVALHVQSVKATPGLWRVMVMRAIVEEGRSPLITIIRNDSEEHYESAVLEITFIGLGRANIHSSAKDIEGALGLSAEPQGWGNLTSPPVVASARSLERVIEPEVESLGAGEVLVRYPSLGLRPHTPHRLQPLLLALPPHFAGTTIAAHWRVTASNAKGDLHGDLEWRLPSLETDGTQEGIPDTPGSDAESIPR